MDIGEELSDQLKEFTRPARPTRAVRPDPWLAASALQKGIRRGDLPTALTAVCVLASKQPDRLWRRLVVIALEDVGIAHLDLVRQVLWASGRKVWRAQNGGDEKVAAFLVTKLCQTAKNREACDLLVIADLHPAYRDHRLEYSGLTETELADILVEADNPLPHRVLAAWYAAGTNRFPGVGLKDRPGNFSTLLEVYKQLGVPPHVLEVSRLGSTRTTEGHPVTLPLVYLEAVRWGGCRIRDENPQSQGLIRGWPSEVYDMHTRPGQKALSLFRRETRDVLTPVAASMDPGLVSDLIGALAFRAEGASVDRRLVHHGSDWLLQMADIAQCGWGGVPADAVPGLIASIFDRLPDLHRCRQIVEGAAR